MEVIRCVPPSLSSLFLLVFTRNYVFKTKLERKFFWWAYNLARDVSKLLLVFQERRFNLNFYSILSFPLPSIFKLISIAATDINIATCRLRTSRKKWGRIKVRQGWTPPDWQCCITAPGSASVWREGRGAGRGLINECYWVVESLCPHSPSCHRDTQWLHQFGAIITSIGKNGGRRGVEGYGERRLLLHHLWIAEQGVKQDVITLVSSKIRVSWRWPKVYH